MERMITPIIMTEIFADKMGVSHPSSASPSGAARERHLCQSAPSHAPVAQNKTPRLTPGGVTSDQERLTESLRERIAGLAVKDYRHWQSKRHRRRQAVPLASATQAADGISRTAG
jgi:hypothetical protein